MSASLATLTVAIPSYQRPQYLRECLDSIVSQPEARDSRFSILICDNSPDDESERAIDDLLEAFPNIRYQRNETNIGAAGNVLRVVERSPGDFVWMMSDDDIHLPGSLARVFAEIDTQPVLNGMLLNQRHYHTDMKTMVSFKNRDLAARAGNRNRHFISGEEALRCFCFHIGAVSTLIVRRSLWNEIIAEKPTSEYFQEYVMSFIYGKAALQGGHFSYINDVILACRTGNDSWVLRGAFTERLRLVVQGGEQLASELFVEFPATRREFRRHTCRVFTGAAVRNFLVAGATARFRWDALRLCGATYADLTEFYKYILPSLSLPRPVLRGLQQWRARRAVRPETGLQAPALQ
ncbi:MAG: glycosyltransferase family 2 protein [Verrucomicrobiales bacterium]